MQKPSLSFGQIWNMCVGFLGIQIGFDLQNNNVSRIFQSLGAEIDSLAILWIAAPMTGLIVQPIIGYFSDKTWTPLGRRRPYFLVGAILASLALVIMPNSPGLWIAASMLWIMDASLNITMEPFRAFVGDNLPDRQRTVGYGMQSFFISLGAVAAGLLPWLMTNVWDVPNTAAAGEVPLSVQISFYVGAACLLSAVLYTVIFSKEYSPQQLADFEKAESAGLADNKSTILRSASQFGRGGLIWLGVGGLLAGFIFVARSESPPAILDGFPEVGRDLYVLAGLIAGFGVVQMLAALFRANKNENGFTEVVQDLFNMPKTMQQLAVVQFFSWFAMFAMWIYAVPAVAATHFGSGDPSTKLYQDAGDWWGVLSTIRNLVAVGAALFIIWLSQRLDNRRLHAFNLVLGAIGFGSMLFISDPKLLWISMIGIGFAWASIVSVPYSILAGAVPAEKMGIYMGVFNIFIVVPQLVAATLLGFLLRAFFAEQAIGAFAIAGISFAIASVATFFVKRPA